MMLGRWGTWEELLLGGAVLRHGTRDWTVVASELRDRLVCPTHTFTPEVNNNKQIFKHKLITLWGIYKHYLFNHTLNCYKISPKNVLMFYILLSLLYIFGNFFHFFFKTCFRHNL
jgi:hypothetical protein